MSMININVGNDLISGSYGKEQFVVKFKKERYDAMVELQKQADAVASFSEIKPILEEFALLTHESFKELVETKCPYIVVNEDKKEFFLVNEGVTSSIPMPAKLAERIIESAEKGVDFLPLVKLWIRFLRNPKLRGLNKTGRINFAQRFAKYINTDFVNNTKVQKLMDEQGLNEETAIKFASVKDVSITQEGLLLTYKAVKEITTKYALDADGNKIIQDRYPKTIDPDTGIVITTKPETAEERLFEPPCMGQGGDAFFCEGVNGYNDARHFVKMGCIIRLKDWSQINTNDSVSCVNGLHRECGFSL